MTSEEKIIKYLDDDLTPEEKKAFDAELKNSDELKKKYLEYLSVKNDIDKIKAMKLNQDYAESILPEFHRHSPKGKRESIRKSLSFAFGVVLLFLISVTVVRIFFNDRERGATIEEFTQSLNSEEKLELLQNLNGESSTYELPTDTELVNLLESDLEINNEVMEEYDISYKEIISELDNKNLEYLYQEILNKNILEEVTL